MMKAISLLLTGILIFGAAASAVSETFEFDFSEMNGSNTAVIETGPKRSVTLCYVNDDSSEFTSVTRTLDADNTEVLIRNVLNELVCGNSYTEGFGGFHSASVPNFEFTRGTLTIDLPIGAAGSKTEQELLIAGTALANTFLSLDEIENVNILIGGKSFFISGSPVGVFTRQVENTALLYADMENGQNDSADPGYTEERTALLYYPTADGNYLLPVARRLSVNNESMTDDILDALGTTEDSDTTLICNVAGIKTLLTDEPRISVSADGERFIEIDLQSILPDYLALSGIGTFGFYGSITLSLTSFIPDIAYVRCTVGGEPLESPVMPDGNKLQITDGRLYREDFAGSIGGTAVIYMVNSENRLTPVDTAMGLHEHASAYGVLRALFETEGADGMRSPVPDGIDSADIIGIVYNDSTAIVDLSAEFYTLCQKLNETDERLLTYAMITTLCELNGIDAVKFTIEGMEIGTFVHNIRLSASLIPDLGLIDRK